MNTELNQKDVRIDHFYLGPGKGSEFKATHLPTGLTAAETVPADSKEADNVVAGRLLTVLRSKIETKGANEKS